jgi:hypothetical protein
MLTTSSRISKPVMSSYTRIVVGLAWRGCGNSYIRLFVCNGVTKCFVLGMKSILNINKIFLSYKLCDISVFLESSEFCRYST